MLALIRPGGRLKFHGTWAISLVTHCVCFPAAPIVKCSESWHHSVVKWFDRDGGLTSQTTGHQGAQPPSLGLGPGYFPRRQNAASTVGVGSSARQAAANDVEIYSAYRRIAAA